MRGVRKKRRCPPGQHCAPPDKKISFDPDALGLTATFSDGRLRSKATMRFAAPDGPEAAPLNAVQADMGLGFALFCLLHLLRS